MPSIPLGVQQDASGNRYLQIPLAAGYTASLASNTNSTLSSLLGPGRLVGSLISSAGRRFEKSIDKFAEKRLGIGPNNAALRVIIALHDIHVDRYYQQRRCESDYVPDPEAHLNVTDHLIWVCNGFCSQCHQAYIQRSLDTIPEDLDKAIIQLLSYLRPSTSQSNLSLAILYIHILVESRVLPPSLIHQLALVDTFTKSITVLEPGCWALVSTPDTVSALKAVLGALLEQISDRAGSAHALRFSVSSAPVTSSYYELLRLRRDSTHWVSRQVATAQMLTYIYLNSRRRSGDLRAEYWAEIQDIIRSDAPDFILQRGTATLEMPTQAVMGSFAHTHHGHSDSVIAVAFSPGNTYIATGSADQSIILWRSSTDFRVMRGHNDWVRAVAFSPDSQSIVSGSDDRTVRLWSVTTGRQTAMLQSHQDSVTAVAYSSDGNLVLSGSGDHSVKIWDSKNRKPLQGTLTGHKESVISVTFSPDNFRVLSTAVDGIIRVWETHSLCPLLILDTLIPDIRCLAFSPDVARVVIGSGDSTVHVCDLATEAEITQFRGHREGITSVCFSSNGHSIVSSSEDKTIQWWNVETGRQIAMLHGSSQQVAISPDQKRIASAVHDGTIRTWDTTALSTSIADAWFQA